MQKRSIWIAGLAFVAAIVAAFSTYAAGLKPTPDPGWFTRITLAYKPYALAGGLTAAACLAFAQFLQVFLARPAFRRKAIQGVLDVLVSECKGNPRNNRVTVFKKAPGWKVWWICWWRLKGRFWTEEEQRKLEAVRNIKWTADYLYVYVRSSQSRRQLSTVAFLVSDNVRNMSQGVAGQVWEEGAAFLPNLDSLKETDRDNARKCSVEEISKKKGPDRLKRYVATTWIKDSVQLRSFDTFARHFMGQVIQVPGVGPWGVLLLDSEEYDCPFPDVDEGGSFGEKFRVQTNTLGNILS